MADYHVLNTDRSGNALRVVFHIPVPDVTNDASYSIRTALVEWQGGSASIESACPFITAGELTQMQAGEVYEIVVELASNPSEDLPAKQTRLDAQHAAQVTEAQALITTALKYWGYDRIIP